MGQQRISAVEDMGDGIDLMGPQGDLRVHAYKFQMTAVIFTGAQGVELLVVQSAKPIPAVGILPDPVLEGLLDHLLLALGDGGFLLVQHRGFLSTLIEYIIEDAHILQIQCLLDDPVAIDPGGAVGVCRLHIAAVIVFVGDAPFAGNLGIANLDPPAGIVGRSEQLIHKTLHHIGRQPGGTQPDGDLAGRKILGLHGLQCLHMNIEHIRLMLGKLLRLGQLCTDIAGQVFIRCQVLCSGIMLPGIVGIQEDHALQVCINLLLGLSGQPGHVVHIHPCSFGQ